MARFGRSYPITRLVRPRPNPKLATLTDNFDSGISSTSWAEIENLASSVNATDGGVKIDHTAAGLEYNSLQTARVYDLTNSSAYLKIVDFGNQALASHQVIMMVRANGGGTDTVTFQAYNGTLRAARRVANVETIVGSSITLDYVAHRWWRIRELGGTTFWDTSPDGTTWTNRWSLANPITLTAVQLRLTTGSFSAEASASYAIFDNFNTTPTYAKVATLTDNFDSGIGGSWTAADSNNPAEVTAVGGAVRIDHTAATETNSLHTVNSYDLTSSYAYVKVVDFGDQTQAGHEVDFAVITSPFTGFVNQVRFAIGGGNVYCQTIVNNSYTTIGGSATLNYTQHRWLRIRESGGTVYWDTSPDGTTWTNLRSTTVGTLDFTRVIPYIAGNEWQVSASATYVIFDNFNTTPAAPAKTETLVDTFATKDVAKWNWGGTSGVVSGQLNLVPASSYGNTISSVAKYRFTGSSIVAKLVSPPNAGSTGNCDTVLRVETGSGTGSSTYVDVGWYGNNTLYFTERASGSIFSQTAVAYNSTNHKWVRLRESGGSIYWDTSPDGTTWTNQRTRTATMDTTECWVYIYSGCGADTSVGTAIWDSVNAKTEYLQDNFATQDTAKWNVWGTPPPAVSSGQLTITPTLAYGGIVTNNAYDVTASSVSMEVVQIPNAGNGTTNVALTLGDVQFSATNKVIFYIGYGNQIGLQEIVGGVSNQTSLTYDSVAMRFIRIRESGGNTLWDTSPDGVTWTNRRTKASGIAMSSLFVTAQAGYDGTEPSPGTAIVDNVNLVPIANLTDDFASLDTNKWTVNGTTSVSSGRLSEAVVSTYNQLGSNQAYDLRESAISIELAQVPNVGNGTTQAALELRAWDRYSNENVVDVMWNGNQLSLYRKAGNVYADTGVYTAYNSTNHRFLRMRESGGTLYFDTAPDGTTWTNLTSMADPIRLDNVYVNIYAGYYGTEPSPGGPVLWDNVNRPPDPGTTVTPTGATLTLTGAAPRLDLTLRPTGASLTLTGSAPRPDYGFRPSGASLALTGAAPSLGLALRPAGATLALTGSAPRPDYSFPPSGGSLTLTGAAPTVTVNQIFTPTAASLSLAGSAPSLDFGLRPAAGSLALTGNSPDVIAPLYPSGGSLTVTGAAPRLDFGIRPAAASLTVTGAAPTVTAPLYPSSATLTLTGSVPVIALGLRPGGANLTLTGSAPTILASQSAVPAGASLTLTGSAPTLREVVFPAAATLTLTGSAPLVGAPFYPSGATLALTGSAPVLNTTVFPAGASLTITGGSIDNSIISLPTGGSMVLVGGAPRLDFGFRPSTGSLTLTGSTPTIVTPQTVSPAGASLSLTGSSPVVALALRPAGGSLTLTGATPVLVTPLTLWPTAGTLSLTGSAPRLDTTVRPSAGSLSLTGAAPTVTAPFYPTPGSLTLTGHAPRLAIAVAPSAGTLTLTGNTSSVITPFYPTPGSLTLTGEVPFIIKPGIVEPNPGTLTLTGHTPDVIWPFTPGGGSLILNGATPTLAETVRPTSAALTLTGYAPVLDLTVRPAPATLTGTGTAPVLHEVTTPSAVEVALAGYDPDIRVSITGLSDPANMLLLPSTPTIYVSQSAVPDPAEPTLTGGQPILREVIFPDGAVLALSGQEPGIELPIRVVPERGNLVLTASAPTSTQAVVLGGTFWPFFFAGSRWVDSP